MLNPHPPAPRADEVVFPSIEEIGDAVALLVKQRPVVIAQDGVGSHEFGFAPFVAEVIKHCVSMVTHNINGINLCDQYKLSP